MKLDLEALQVREADRRWHKGRTREPRNGRDLSDVNVKQTNYVGKPEVTESKRARTVYEKAEGHRLYDMVRKLPEYCTCRQCTDARKSREARTTRVKQSRAIAVDTKLSRIHYAVFAKSMLRRKPKRK